MRRVDQCKAGAKRPPAHTPGSRRPNAFGRLVFTTAAACLPKLPGLTLFCSFLHWPEREMLQCKKCNKLTKAAGLDLPLQLLAPPRQLLVAALLQQAAGQGRS